MRNLCFATALAELEGHTTSGLLLAYVAAAVRRGEDAEELFREFKAMLLPDVARHAGAITYEQIAEIVRDHDDSALADWINHPPPDCHPSPVTPGVASTATALRTRRDVQCATRRASERVS